MTGELLLLAAAVASVLAIFAGPLLLGDFQNEPCHQKIDRRRREPWSY